MYIQNNENKVLVTGIKHNNDSVSFLGNFDIVPMGEIVLKDEDDWVMFTTNIADWLRAYIENGKLILTNVPEPVPHVLTLEELREQALERIKGKCSATIESGIVVDGKKYLLRKYDDQNALTAALEKVRNGAETVPFKALGDILPQPYTAAQIETIAQIAENWGQVNLGYRALLPVWIARETDADVLRTIDYGVPLPDDLMQELATNLAGFGIDITDYADMLNTLNTEVV